MESSVLSVADLEFKEKQHTLQRQRRKNLQIRSCKSRARGNSTS